MGHPEKECETKIKDTTYSTIEEGLYRDWMRVQGSGGAKRVVNVDEVRSQHIEIGQVGITE